MATLIQTEPKQSWFDTLNEALNSEGLGDYWDIGLHIDYGQTVRLTTEDGKKNSLLISVTRSSTGSYERPVHYQL